MAPETPRERGSDAAWTPAALAETRPLTGHAYRRIQMWKWNLASSLGASLLATVASAQSQPVTGVADILFHQGQWTYHAVYSEVGGLVRVNDVVLLANPSSLRGGNLAGVWYQRTATGWHSTSWESCSVYEVIAAVKAELNISDIYDGAWHVPATAEISTAASAGEAQDYARGILANDPLAWWVDTHENRDEIIESLTAIGWGSADILGDKTLSTAGICDGRSVIAGIAAAVEHAYATGSTAGAAVAAAYSLAVEGACEGAAGPAQSIILGGEWFTSPSPENLDPQPPVLAECVDLPDGRRLCSWNQPGDWVERRWCLRFPPPDQHGPPTVLCEQSRQRGRCVRSILCPGDVNPPAFPPCAYSRHLECPPGHPTDPSHIPWEPDNTTNCPECAWPIAN